MMIIVLIVLLITGPTQTAEQLLTCGFFSLFGFSRRSCFF